MALELFPRLPAFAAEMLWEQLRDPGGAANELPSFRGCFHDALVWTATGGVRTSEQRLIDIRENVLQLAINSGFPSQSGDRQKTRFDAACARYLVEDAQIPFAEACRRDVWSYFCIILLPDVVGWRFSVRAKERWVGGIRNAFQILWRRGYLIGCDQPDLGKGWAELERLTQDAFVQILERTRLSGNPKVARILARAWVRCADEIGQSNMEAIAREALKALSAYGRTRSFHALGTDDLYSLAQLEFRRAARHLHVATN